APIVIPKRNGQNPVNTRSRLFWACFSAGRELDSFTLDDLDRTALFELLADLMRLRQKGIHPAANQSMAWLKDAVRTLSQLAGHVARRTQDNDLHSKLLNLACQDASHFGF